MKIIKKIIHTMGFVVFSSVLFVVFNIFCVVFATPAGDNIIISEIEYDPAGAENEGEWFELYNPTGGTIDVSGWVIREGSTPFYTFSASTTIGPDDYLLVVNDTTEFMNTYPAVVPDIDMSGPDCYRDSECIRLNNAGDELVLYDEHGTVIDYVGWEDYVAGWSVEAASGESVCRATSTDTDLPADWVNCATPDPGEGTLAPFNVSPIDIMLSTNTVDENLSHDTTVGQLTTTDPDSGDTHTYSFCGGDDDAVFSIDGDNMKSATTFDFEAPVDSDANGNYELCVRTDDGHGGTFDKNFTIIVNNVDESDESGDAVDSSSDDSADVENKTESRTKSGREIHRPRKVTLSCLVNGTNLLEWSDRSKKENGNTIQRRTDYGEWEIIKKLRVRNREHWTDENVTSGHLYTYRIRTFAGNDISKWSDEVECATSHTTTQQEALADSQKISASGTTCSYMIRGGDTLGSIAEEQLGQFMHYEEILTLNQEKYPTILENLTIGDVLQLPC